MAEEKAKYRVLRLSHMHNNLWPEGSEVEYEGKPGTNLYPLNDAAKAAYVAAGHKMDVVDVDPSELNGDGGDGDDNLDKLREEYEALFNEKPHHNTKAENLRDKIAERRKELGQ